jgi:predicted dehydrogenase
MNKLKTVNWGIIGVGDVTEVKSGPAFYKTQHSRLVAVMRRDAQKAADYAHRHNVRKWYSNASELINDVDVDAVYVATPPDSHASYAIETMHAGKPVYVEKPMARNSSECKQMLAVSEQTGMPLWVAYYRRTLPAFLKAKEMIEAGEIGRPITVSVRLFTQAMERNQATEDLPWRVIPEVAGAGHFFDLASHQFDYLDFIFGDVTKVEGKAANRGGLYPAEDTVSGTWTHESGVRGSGQWCFIADPGSEQDTIDITGEKGRIRLSSFAFPDRLNVTTQHGDTELTFDNPEHISQNLVRQVVNELRGVGTCVSTGVSAARTSRVLDQMVADYYRDRGK